jgi:hypothetical protein
MQVGCNINVADVKFMGITTWEMWIFSTWDIAWNMINTSQICVCQKDWGKSLLLPWNPFLLLGMKSLIWPNYYLKSVRCWVFQWVDTPSIPTNCLIRGRVKSWLIHNKHYWMSAVHTILLSYKYDVRYPTTTYIWIVWNIRDTQKQWQKGDREIRERVESGQHRKKRKSRRYMPIKIIQEMMPMW